MTFILRITTRDQGGVSGIVERVRTGEKHRFYGLDALEPLLVRLVAAEAAEEEHR